MKITIIILILLCAAYISNAQKLKESAVPSAVRTAFVSMYPNAKHIKWSMEDGKYEGEFKENSIESSALFEADGAYVQTETEIPASSLPETVKQYVSKNLAGEKIKEAAKITDAKSTVTYEAEVGGTDYIFDANGNFLKKDSESGDTEDEDKK